MKEAYFRARYSFKHDPFGRRIYKSSSSGTSIYANDGDNLIEETNSSGAVRRCKRLRRENSDLKKSQHPHP